jgi:NAD dependent epimerase/dehydratase family
MVEPEAWMRSGRCRPQGSKGRRSVSWRCRQSRMIHGCGVRPKPSIAPAGASSRLVCRKRARLHRNSHPDSREPPRSYRPTPPALALNMAVDFDDAKLTKQLSLGGKRAGRHSDVKPALLQCACCRTTAGNRLMPGSSAFSPTAPCGATLLNIHRDGSQSRDFVHVDDPVRAVLAALARTPATGPGCGLGRDVETRS